MLRNELIFNQSTLLSRNRELERRLIRDNTAHGGELSVTERLVRHNAHDLQRADGYFAVEKYALLQDIKKLSNELNASRAMQTQCAKRNAELTEQLRAYCNVNQSLHLSEPESRQATFTTHAQRVESESENRDRSVYVAVIAVLVLLYLVSMAVCIRKAWINRIHRLQEMKNVHVKEGKKEQAPALGQGVADDNEGVDTVGRWNPERFDEMLDNAEMVQEVIVDGIIGEMETEGMEKAEEEQDVLDSIGTKHSITPF